MNATAPRLRSSAESTVEAVGHVDGHVGSSQLLKRLGIQHQEECAFILEERTIWPGKQVSISLLDKFGQILVNCLTLPHWTVWCSALLIRQLCSGLILAAIIHHPILSCLHTAFSCNTLLWHLLSRRHIKKAVPSLMFKRETNSAD